MPVPYTRSPIPFVLDSAQLLALCEEAGVDLEAYLISLVQSLPKLALVPISNFHVTAIGVGVSGHAYLGVNLEFHGLPLSNSVHAEQFMVANAIHHGEASLKLIVVSHAPCGHCRQFLQELRSAGDIRIVIADGNLESRTLHEWLPHRFGPQDLLDDDFPLLMESRHHGLELAEDQTGNGSVDILETGIGRPSRQALVSDRVSNSADCSRVLDSSELDSDVLLKAAISAANSSYSPYSNSPSGLSFRTRQGTVFAGSYVESAAYNPSLPPLQNAIVAMISQGSHYVYSDIQEVILAEIKGAPVQYSGSIKMILEKIAPEASFMTVSLERKS